MVQGLQVQLSKRSRALMQGGEMLQKGCHGRSGPHTLHIIGRVQTNATTLQLALAPALLILLAHLQQLLPWGKGFRHCPLPWPSPDPATGSRTEEGEEVVGERN